MTEVPGLLLPDRDADSGPFWDAALQGRLAVQTCRQCGLPRLPPRPMCARCRSLESHWVDASGRARLWSWVVAHPPLLPAYMPFAPFPVVVVELEDPAGIRLVGNVVAAAGAPINSVDPAQLEFGQPLQVVFERIADDVALPRWVPV